MINKGFNYENKVSLSFQFIRLFYLQNKINNVFLHHGI